MMGNVRMGGGDGVSVWGSGGGVLLFSLAGASSGVTGVKTAALTVFISLPTSKEYDGRD